MKVLLLLPGLWALAASSHVQVTIGGSSYSHGVRQDMPQVAAVHKPTARPAYKMPTPSTTYAPARAPPYTPAPTSSLPPRKYGYKPIYPAPVAYRTPAPVVQYHKPAYVAQPAYKPVAYKPAAYHPKPQYGYAPKKNCSVMEEMAKAEVCTPTLRTVCSKEDVMVKRVTEREQCQMVTKTVCAESIETVDNEVCTYAYKKKMQAAAATSVKVTFERMCDTQMVTVCQPNAGYGYHSYGRQYCKEVSQETCYNSPMVMPMEEPVELTYPQPMRECVNRPISLPRVTCSDMTEDRCFLVPDIVEDVEMVDKCEVVIGEPKCEMVELSLPKQVCRDLVYGQAYDIDENMYKTMV